MYMKRKNKILVGCLALLLVLSVGYALFSETITINGTATAKGNFDMTATCTSGISSKLGTVESLGLDPEGGYENDSCTVVDDVVSANVHFNSIGYSKYFTVKITNSGTMDAELDMTKITKEITFCYSNDINATVSNSDICQTRQGGYSIAGGSYGPYDVSTGNITKAISDANDNILSSSEIGTYFDSQNGIVTLPPNYSAYVILNYSIDTVANDTTTKMINAKLTTNLEIPFVQAQ